jgi:hypothetical protein
LGLALALASGHQGANFGLKLAGGGDPTQLLLQAIAVVFEGQNLVDLGLQPHQAIAGLGHLGLLADELLELGLPLMHLPLPLLELIKMLLQLLALGL